MRSRGDRDLQRSERAEEGRGRPAVGRHAEAQLLLLDRDTGAGAEDAVDFADYSMEAISYHAILASTELARERGAYPTYEGSKWSQGLLPIDTMETLAAERGMKVDVDRTCRFDWQPVRDAVKRHGMRNSNVMAIAPTATAPATTP